MAEPLSVVLVGDCVQADDVMKNQKNCISGRRGSTNPFLEFSSSKEPYSFSLQISDVAFFKFLKIRIIIARNDFIRILYASYLSKMGAIQKCDFTML
jgi:hypothetical protein